MKIAVDFNTPITQPRGEIIPISEAAEGKEPKCLTLGFCAENVLGNPVPDDKRDGVQKGRDWKLLLEILATDGYNTVELNDKQRKHLIELIRAGYPAPMICAQAALIIDPDPDEEEEEE